jgi:hypothetical protein
VGKKNGIQGSQAAHAKTSVLSITIPNEHTRPDTANMSSVFLPPELLAHTGPLLGKLSARRKAASST